MIEAIGALTPIVSPLAQTDIADVSHGTQSSDFASLLESQIGQLGQDVGEAEAAIQQLASGQPVELHNVMISLEKARISVQTFIQIRNRVLDAYQELSRMQI